MLNGQKINIKTGGNYLPIPMDRYTLQIKDVSLVKQFNQFVGREEDVLNYQFVVLDEKSMPETTDDAGKVIAGETTRGRFLWKRCRPALNAKSWLGKLANAAIGRDLTKDEQATFDPESIIGKQVDVMVNQSENKDHSQIFNNVVAFSKTVKPLAPFEDGVAGSQKVLETSTVPVTAPKDDPDEFADTLAAEGKAKETGGKVEPVEGTDDEAAAQAEVEAAEKALAKAKAARAKVAK